MLDASEWETLLRAYRESWPPSEGSTPKGHAMAAPAPLSFPGDTTGDPLSAPFLLGYRHFTGIDERRGAKIAHHRVSLHGPPCADCGKPLRTPRARICVACGARRTDPPIIADRDEPPPLLHVPDLRSMSIGRVLSLGPRLLVLTERRRLLPCDTEAWLLETLAAPELGLVDGPSRHHPLARIVSLLFALNAGIRHGRMIELAQENGEFALRDIAVACDEIGASHAAGVVRRFADAATRGHAGQGWHAVQDLADAEWRCIREVYMRLGDYVTSKLGPFEAALLEIRAVREWQATVEE